MTTIFINPPPQNHKCYVCGEVADLHKTFRQDFPFSDYDQIGASWECEECLRYPDELVALIRMEKISIEGVRRMDDDELEAFIRDYIEETKEMRNEDSCS